MRIFPFLLLTVIIGCNNNSGNKPVSTLDSETLVAPQPNQVVTDTNNHNVGSQSDIALDSPNGTKIRDTNYHH